MREGTREHVTARYLTELCFNRGDINCSKNYDSSMIYNLAKTIAFPYVVSPFSLLHTYHGPLFLRPD